MFLEGWKLKEGKRIKESQILWKSRSQVSGSENLEVYGHEIRKKESYIKFKNETNKCFAYTCTTLNFQMLWVMAPIVPVVLPC